MNIREYILTQIKNPEGVTSQELVKHTGRTRQYIHKVITKMIEEGLVVRLGQTRDVRYVTPSADLVNAIASRPFEITRRYSTKGLDENIVFSYIEDKTNILDLLPENVFRAFRHAFTEMLNNAIDHSNSKTIEVNAKRTADTLSFSISDSGIGIFKNIQQKFSLASEQQAMLDVIKGKLTTLPDYHSGQGIFFTSRVADKFSIESSKYWLLRDNIVDDTFFKPRTNKRGTKINFEIATDSKRDLTSIFNKYSSVDDGFTKSDYKVKLYKIDDQFVSRSQAKKLMHGLDKFETIELDFKRVEFVGQGFADEVFRVWQSQYPHVKIKYTNSIPEVDFMIKRVKNEKNR